MIIFCILNGWLSVINYVDDLMSMFGDECSSENWNSRKRKLESPTFLGFQFPWAECTQVCRQSVHQTDKHEHQGIYKFPVNYLSLLFRHNSCNAVIALAAGRFCKQSLKLAIWRSQPSSMHGTQSPLPCSNTTLFTRCVPRIL
jgi:hypothetical protein